VIWMEINELFQKLKPVLGDKVKALWLEYVLNPDSRQEIEGLLRVLADKHLDQDFESKQILLQPPGKEQASGEYLLGEVYYGTSPLFQFGLREDEWIQHVAIFGRTGSGKTNVGFLLVQNLLDKGKPFLIFDWKRNYRDLLPIFKNIAIFTVGREISPFTFNPLIPPPGTPPTIWLKKLIEILCHVYWLGEGVAYLLQKAIDDVYRECGVYEQAKRFPTLMDVRGWLEDYKAKRREAEWMDSTLRAVATLCYGDIGKVVNSPSIAIEELLKHNVILELDALTNSDKTFLIESLLLWIHHYRLQEKERETFKHAIIIEEAHHVLLKKKETKETIMDIILREIRELGEAIVLIDQHPSLISIPSIGNTYCTIAMNLKHARDVNTIGEAMLLNNEEREYLGRLPVGVGIVKLQGRYFKPFLVKFPLLEVEKGSIPDEEIKSLTKGYSEKFKVISTDSGEPEEIPVVQAAEKRKIENSLSEEERKLLEDIGKFAVSGIADRFRRLNITPHKGYKILEALVSAGFIISSFIATTKGRLRFLQLSDKGKRLIDSKEFSVLSTKGGPEHEYWKHKVADKLKEQGYSVELEREVHGHYVDILATKGEEAIAVEVETGKSDAEDNVRKDLEAGLKVICLALSKTLVKRLEEIFAREIENRSLELVRPDEIQQCTSVLPH
jgi:DNA-binding MarR family transcriptional regulator